MNNNGTIELRQQYKPINSCINLPFDSKLDDMLIMNLTSNNKVYEIRIESTIESTIKGIIESTLESTVKKSTIANSVNCNEIIKVDSLNDVNNVIILSESSIKEADIDISAFTNYFFTDESALTKKFIEILSDDIVESGYSTKAEEFVLALIENEPIKTRIWINKVFYDYFEKEHYVIGILHLLSHIDYQLVYPEAQIIAIAALSHKDAQVREFAIKAFENWCQKESLVILKNIKCNEEWLQQYLDQVILSIEQG